MFHWNQSSSWTWVFFHCWLIKATVLSLFIFFWGGLRKTSHGPTGHVYSLWDAATSTRGHFCGWIGWQKHVKIELFEVDKFVCFQQLLLLEVVDFVSFAGNCLAKQPNSGSIFESLCLVNFIYSCTTVLVTFSLVAALSITLYCIYLQCTYLIYTYIYLYYIYISRE